MAHRFRFQFLRPARRALGWGARQIDGLIGRHGEMLALRPGGPVRGSVAFAYLTDPWIYPESINRHYHTNRWESWLMAETFREAGYRVEVVNYDNIHYRPPVDCAFAFDLERNLDRWTANLPPGCVKLHHASTTHWLHWNRAELRRIAGIQQRRGISLVPRRQIPPNRCVEAADHMLYVGNAFTAETYAYAGRPMHRIPISTVITTDWPAQKDWDQARRHFIWFGSVGLAHKGLDLALEAFVRMPGLHLTVAGAVDLDQDFKAAYHRELFATPNIKCAGFVDVCSPAFLELVADCAGVVYPSCAEGGAGSVICCMHAGLVPLVTREASIDVGDFGLENRSDAIDDIIADVQRFAALPPGEVATRSRAAWEHVRRVHSRENFRRVWRQFARETLKLSLRDD
ncbi:MAG TPA: glycosyltransferase [Opitutaceae bacterium]|nr:glycosyltransferase [Opitutaceae bacterium]